MAEQSNSKVNLNDADVKALAALPGVTDELAQNIVARREKQSFETIEDVKSVEGFSDELFDQLQPLVTVLREPQPDDAVAEPAGDSDEEPAVEAADESEAVESPEPVESDEADETPDAEAAESPTPIEADQEVEETLAVAETESPAPAETEEGEESPVEKKGSEHPRKPRRLRRRKKKRTAIWLFGLTKPNP